MATERIEKNVVVGIEYRLTLDDGTMVDSTDGRGPLEYLHGHGNLIPGLEKALEGLEIGADLSITFRHIVICQNKRKICIFMFFDDI